tara:strand:+ start:6611 stop:7378 length:768 start_codon:yes stop_codon:yes gene_type:complete
MEQFWQDISNNSFSEDPSIQVYQTNIQGSKLKALNANFPLTKKFLGEPLFKAISKHFINHINSVNDSLNVYGKEFPEFLKEIIPHNAKLKGKDYLIDLAKLDWAMIQSYFALDDDSSINWQMSPQNDTAYLTLASHVKFVSFQHIDLTKPSNTLFAGLSSGMLTNALIENLAEQLSQKETTTYLLIYRIDFDVHVMQLTTVEHELFLLLQARTPLFKLEESLLKLCSPAQISSLISKFKTAGILIGINESDNDEF